MGALLTITTKMPGASFSLPAGITCPTGAKLRHIPGSVCAICYAQKGRYYQPVVKAAQARRYALSQTDEFIPLMIEALNREAKCGRPDFRWHDSGDLYSEEYLRRVLHIVRMTPSVRHRIPTKETKLIADHQSWLHGELSNLAIQLSCPMIDAVAHYDIPGCGTAVTYTTPAAPAAFFACPATNGQKVCGDCRKCWECGSLVGYRAH